MKNKTGKLLCLNCGKRTAKYPTIPCYKCLGKDKEERDEVLNRVKQTPKSRAGKRTVTAIFVDEKGREFPVDDRGNVVKDSPYDTKKDKWGWKHTGKVKKGQDY